jgi:hypothetical protein
VRLEVPLQALRRIRAVVRYRGHLEWLVQNFEKSAPIPLRFNKHGQLELDGDGNHRLGAARALKLVTCKIVVRFRGRPEAERKLRRLFGPPPIASDR